MKSFTGGTSSCLALPASATDFGPTVALQLLEWDLRAASSGGRCCQASPESVLLLPEAPYICPIPTDRILPNKYRV